LFLPPSLQMVPTGWRRETILSRGGVVISFQALWRHGLKPGSPSALLFAVACVAAAVVLQELFGVDPDFAVFAPYYAAVLVATVVAGWSAGALASLLGLVALLWIFVPSRFLFHLFSRREAADVILYLATSGTIVAIADHYRSLVRRLREEEHYRRLVVDELQHRIANKAATLHAIIGYELRDNAEVWEKVAGRLRAIAATDKLIAASDGRGAAIADVLAAELGPYDAARVMLAGEPVELPQKPAVTLALVFHELATNAAKYGALSAPDGQLSIAWATDVDRLTINWVERGGPPVVPPSRNGFGSKLFRRALDPYHGRVERTFDRSGLKCRITLALMVEPDAVPVPAPAPEVRAA
jgi:two-component sensor histidine kinase